MIDKSASSTRGAIPAWLRRWCRRWMDCTPQTKVRKRPLRYLPSLECFEDRVVPAVLTVNSLLDTTTAGTSLTLREAVLLVDGTLGRALTTAEQAQVTGTLGTNDTIQFKLPSGSQTITLTGGALDITKSVTITGPGAANLTINGNNADRVFVVGQIWSSEPEPGSYRSAA